MFVGCNKTKCFSLCGGCDHFGLCIVELIVCESVCVRVKEGGAGCSFSMQSRCVCRGRDGGKGGRIPAAEKE